MQHCAAFSYHKIMTKGQQAHDERVCTDGRHVVYRFGVCIKREHYPQYDVCSAACCCSHGLL